MFNTIHHHRHVESPCYPQEIHEHRAPTDASVRLLREMEEKARDSILLAIHGDANSFKFKAVVWEEHCINQLKLRIQFTLNESPKDHELTLPDSYRSKDHTEWLLIIRDQIAKVIAGDIVVSVCSDSVLRNKLSRFAP